MLKEICDVKTVYCNVDESHKSDHDKYDDIGS